jgi:nucleotide-binding universal stress UspA family protein
MMSAKLNILIGYDGSDCANRALGDLRRAGLPDETEALILSVAGAPLPPPPASVYELFGATLDEPSARPLISAAAQSRQEAMKTALAGSERLQADFPSWRVRVEVSSGSPAQEILNKAEEWPADLIALGSHGRSGIKQLILGSVSQKVLAEAECAVRIGRGGPQTDSPVRVILIGIDGSDYAEAAVREVARRAWLPGTKARIIKVIDSIEPTAVGRLVRPLVAWTKEITGEEVDVARENLKKAVEELRAAGLQTLPVVVTGDPKRVLVNEAALCHAGCIFIGAKGSGRLESFFLGSVSSWVAAHAPCSVEVVRMVEEAQIGNYVEQEDRFFSRSQGL